MKWVEQINRFAELLGVLISLLPIGVKLLFGATFSDISFSKVISIVNTSLFLRQIAHSLFYSVVAIIVLAAIGSYYSPYKYKAETRARYFHLVIRILTGWIIGNWLLYWTINRVFYRNAIVTYPFLLGSAILLLTIVGVGLDHNLYEDDSDVTSIDINRILLVLRYAGLGGLSLIIIIPTLVPMAGFQPSPPTDPSTYGGDRGPYTVGQIRLEHQVPANISEYLIPDNDNSTWYIFLYYPRLDEPRQVPLTILAHGYTGTDPSDYENTLYQLASRGSAVVFVQYVTDVELGGNFTEPEDTNFTRSNAMYFRYLMEWSGILQAVEMLSTADILGESSLDTNYVQIIGHSVGGGMVPYLATKIVERGWGSQQLILDLETPWFPSEHPQVRYNLSRLPNQTIINVVGTEDDHLASPCIGMLHYERFITTLPVDNTAYLIIPSDYHGFPRLVATHYVVTTALDDTLTSWGYMKRVDAMVALLQAQANGEDSTGIREYFLGGEKKMITQGYWSDGTAVNPLTYSKDPFGLRGGENIAQQYINTHEVGKEICVF